MAKNPIAVNDGGLFRFVDFMNYVPDFLKEEEDVVTLMQLFSDYLNNAYRNLEDSTRFTFNYFATESTAKELKNRIDEFVKKLSACDSNNLYCCGIVYFYIRYVRYCFHTILTNSE